MKKPVIGIVGGRGILGSIFRKAFEDAGFEVLISGRKPDRKKILANKTLAKKADIVIVSVFLKDTQKVLSEITPLLTKKQLLCDFTSVKEFPMDLMKKSKSEVVGLHPMFGEIASLQGKIMLVCKVRNGKLWKILRKAFEEFGLKIHEVSAKKHDELAALHQASAHLLSLAFALLLKKKKVAPQKLFEIAAPATQLLLLKSGRMLNQDLEMYTDIQLKNPHTKRVVLELAEIFTNLACEVLGEERETLLKNFKQASKFFGKWTKFASEESERIFENLEKKTSEELPKKSSPKNAVGVFGENTQTEIAAREFLKKRKLKNPIASFNTITDIFNSVSNGKSVFGFVPLENLTIGPVRETMLNLFNAKEKVKIFAEIIKPISHSLLGRDKIKFNKIEKVFAHPQAIAQCQNFLQKNFSKAEIIETPNAGDAIQHAKQKSNSLAIGPAFAAQATNLKIIRKNIENSANNRTRFVAICRSSAGCKLKTANCKKTAIAFFFSRNKAGQLSAALELFAENQINLSRIESIPTEKKQGEFFFFTECEVNKKLPEALKKLGKIANVVNLGSY